MEVILLDDIISLGHEGDVVEVADGYARNYLIPQKLVVKATAGNLKQLEYRRSAIRDRENKKRIQALELAETLKEESIIIRAPVGEGGRLHGEVTAQNIADAVAEQHGIEISRHDVDIPTPIREKGNYLISASLYKEVAAELPVRVIGLDDEENAEPTIEQPNEVAAEEESPV